MSGGLVERAGAAEGGCGVGVFEVSEAERALYAGMVSEVDTFVTLLAVRFANVGSAPIAGASLAASLLLGAAWKYAAVTRIAEGGTPAPDNFIQLARDVTERFRFDEDAIRSALAEAEGGAA